MKRFDKRFGENVYWKSPAPDLRDYRSIISSHGARRAEYNIAEGEYAVE